jgi:hypothetical protein
VSSTDCVSRRCGDPRSAAGLARQSWAEIGTSPAQSEIQMHCLSRVFLFPLALTLPFLVSPASAQIFQPPGGAPPAATPPREEIKSLATDLRGNPKALAKLKPTPAQVAQIAATPDDGAKISAYVEKVFATLPPDGLSGSPGQTEILVSESLPGGYDRIKDRLKPGVVIYGFKYVEPGKDIGMAFDGLIKLDGQWIIIPKLWRAFAQ